MESQYLDEIKKIKSQLPAGSYKIIAQMTGGKYKPNTVAKMFTGNRTMKPVVLESARKLIGIMNQQNTVK